MSTSLREQLLKLQTPQSSQFVDSKRRDSILFTQKDAATKSRETIYEIGLSGLKELIEIDAIFAEFEQTLFDFTAKDVQRAVETDEVNRLLNKNIKKFMFYLSPYFLIPSSHKCLEWLIRRFNVNLYNKDEMMILILPYHQTNMFVRCIQIMKFDDPSDKWYFLAEVKKTSSPLSKLSIWNHGATQPAFLEFVGKFTFEAVKELELTAVKLQTMISFYFTTIVGSLEQAPKINDNHILTVSKYLVKTFKSNILDYSAAGYMITAQLLTKASLKVKLLYELMDRITKSVNIKLTKDCILLLALMFQTQTDELRISDITLQNLMNIKGIWTILKQIKNEGKFINDFYKALIYKLLVKIQENDEDFQQYKEFCETLINEIDMDDDLANIIIRTILDSYVQEESTNGDANQTDDEVITLDSDDENIPLKSQDITIWYSNLLKMLERQYPIAFDLVVKNVMTRNPGRKRNGLKNVLGFLLNVSCSTNDTNIFENLYHHNPHIRSEAVSYLVKNLKSIERTPENIDILKMTLTERLNDDNPLVVNEMLKMDFKFLNETVGSDELIARLSKILMKFWSKAEKWRENAILALKIMTSDVYDGCSDPNIVLLSIMPFLFPNSSDKNSFDFIDIIKNSNYAATQNVLKNLPNIPKDHSKWCELMNEYFGNNKHLPSADSILETIKNFVNENHRFGSFKENFGFYLLACSLNGPIDHQFTLDILQTIKSVYNFSNTVFNNLIITDNHLRNNEVSTNLIAIVLTKIIKCTNVSSFSINFANPNLEMKVLHGIFSFIVDLYFKVQQSYRGEINGIMIEFLDKVCESNEMKKLDFLSQFCVLHAQCENSVGNLELQVRVMKLLQHVLASNLIDVQNYSNSMHENIVLSLCSKSNKIRELGIEIVEVLEQQSVADRWKFFYGKIISRKSEILMDNEQIKMIMYLLASKKSSKYIQDIKDNMLKTISNEATFDYIQSELLMLLKHFTDKKVLDVSAQIAIKIIDEFHSNENYYFNENHAAILKLILMKFNHATVSGLWNLAIKSLNCHYIMNDEDGKILTPSILLLQSIDNELYVKLHPDHKLEIFNAIINCSMNEQPRIIQMAQKVFCSIDPDYKIIRNSLMKLARSTQKKNAKSNELFESIDWKFGVAVLELLQNKTKDIDGEHELIEILFDILQNCLRSADSDMEYVKQIILSLLLTICKQMSSSGKNHRALGINDSVFKTELIIRCIKETQNPQTHHHSLLLLAQLALMIPDQVLRDIMTIFTFVGTTLVRHDDSYSFQIITKIIENIIPNFLKGAQKEEVVPILKTFATIALDVPVHRRLMLYVKLMNTFGAENYLWMFIATLLEIQVSQHHKGDTQEDLPARLQIALSIAKEFDIKTIIITATSLIVYLKELPMMIDNTKSKLGSNENEIFCLGTHTNGQIRHFKYLVSLSLKYTLESPEIVNMAHQMSQEMVTEMKTQFQDLILNTLILIPDITRFIELKQHEKSWQIILQTSFDILEASIALLAPDMLLVVVERLICHDFLVVRKKVLELLNRKLEENYFKKCENQKLLKLMVPLKNVYESIGEENTKLAEEVVQQLALITIKLLAKKLCEESPEPFSDCLNHLTNVLVDKNARVPVMINLVDCTAELVGELKVHSISLLGRIMPNLIKLLTVQDDNPSTLLLLHSATSSLLRIIETVPLFLSPYLVQIILQLIRVYPVLKLLNDSKISSTLSKIHKIWETFAESIPTRILVPTINEIYDKINQKKQFTSIEPLMELMNELFQRADIKDIKSHQAELTDFFLKALQFRCNVKIEDEIYFSEINDIEFFIIRALISLILKQSEGSFRPLFENISNWAIKDKEENDNNRLITFFRLTTEISIALKSLFLLFASDLVECAGLILDKCNSSKDGGELMFDDNTEKTLYLIEFILKTLNNMFLNDHQNFINSHRFGQIMQSIVDQIENVDVLKKEDLCQLLRMTIAQLAVAASDDILWKQLNHQVLLKTRSENPDIRILGVKTCVDIARKLTEDYETLIPETIPFLSELLADEDYHVVQTCENAVRELETIVGESLQKYF